MAKKIDCVYCEYVRRRARVDEWGRLESDWALTGPGGSNPPVSANLQSMLDK